MSKQQIQPRSTKTSKDKDEAPDSHELQGWPGHRTRTGRSGYDPMNSRAEVAHSAGRFIYKLLTLQLSIKNSIYLLLFGGLTIALITPLLLAVLELAQGTIFPSELWYFFLITGLIGLVMLINFVKNLIRFAKQ